MNRPLLHAEELEGRIIADGPTCTCHSNNVCPTCGSAEADVGCAVHDGHMLAALLKSPSDEAVAAALEGRDILDVLELADLDVPDALDEIRGEDKTAVLDWLENEAADPDETCLRAEELLKAATPTAALNWLVSKHADLLREWINENVEAEMTTDDLGQKVPTLNITGL